MSEVKNYFSLVTFSHTIFAMPFALLGLTMGFDYALKYNVQTDYLKITILVVLCMVFARSAAMGFNRYLDADIDALNQRTKNREIPAGVIKRRDAGWFVVAMSLAFIACTYFINTVCFYLSPVALFVVLFYSYTKRFTSLCHLVLGLGLALAPVGAFMAVTGEVQEYIVYLGLTVLLWVAGFDVIYSLQDVNFDKSQNLHSIPVRLGMKGAIWFSRVLHVLCAVTLFFALELPYHWSPVSFALAFGLFVLFLIYQHWIVNPQDLSNINRQYMTVNGIASLVFCSICIASIIYKMQ